MDFDRLSKITHLIAKVVDGQDLTSDETEEVFTTIFLFDTDGYHFTAFMSAIHAKGETVEELMGLVKTFKKLSESLQINAQIDKVIDVSGTGGGSFKTINVSTAVAFVIASVGYTVPKASYYGVTNSTGSADIFTHFGIDIAKLTKEKIEDILNTVGICPFYIPFISPQLKNRGQLFKKVYKDHQLKVRTPAHLITNAFSPFPIKRRIYGCYSEQYLEVLAQVFVRLEYERTLTFYSEDGMPEISNVGTTILVEQKSRDVQKRIFTPNNFGVKEAKLDDIKAGTKEQNIEDFVNILKGKETGPKADLVAINAGAAFYVLNDVSSLKKGTEKAKKILKSGKAFSKLTELQNKMKR